MSGKGMPWGDAEKKEIQKYFYSSITPMTLYQRLLLINPNRSYESMSRELRRWKQHGNIKPRQRAINTLRVGYLDIEASNLNADFGYMLSWYIKMADKNQYDFSVITKEEIFGYEFDGRLVTELLMAFDNYDVLYTHYGSDRRFDVPFIRTRAYAHELQEMLPEYMDKFILDTYPIARNKLKLHSNRLDSIANALGIKDVVKTPLNTQVWQLASVGHGESLQYIADHNKKDVQLLEKVHKKLMKIERPIYRSI